MQLMVLRSKRYGTDDSHLRPGYATAVVAGQEHHQFSHLFCGSDALHRDTRDRSLVLCNIRHFWYVGVDLSGLDRNHGSVHGGKFECRELGHMTQGPRRSGAGKTESACRASPLQKNG